MRGAGGSLYQTLEGRRDEVARTLEQIKRDQRRDCVIPMKDEASAYRACAAWSMAHRDLPHDHEITGGITRIAAGADLSYRTRAAVLELVTLIASFLGPQRRVMCMIGWTVEGRI